jgi:hypothetical protein
MYGYMTTLVRHARSSEAGAEKLGRRKESPELLRVRDILLSVGEKVKANYPPSNY